MIIMAFTKEQIEYYHDIGLMPDWAYYQQNGASAQENFDRQRAKFKKQMLDRLQEERNQKQIEKQIEDKVDEALEDIMNKLLKDITFNTIIKY